MSSSHPEPSCHAFVCVFLRRFNQRANKQGHCFQQTLSHYICNGLTSQVASTPEGALFLEDIVAILRAPIDTIAGIRMSRGWPQLSFRHPFRAPQTLPPSTMSTAVDVPVPTADANGLIHGLSVEEFQLVAKSCLDARALAYCTYLSRTPPTIELLDTPIAWREHSKRNKGGREIVLIYLQARTRSSVSAPPSLSNPPPPPVQPRS